MTQRRVAGTGSIQNRNGRFTARARVDGRLVSLGTYSTEGEAERVLSAANAKLAEHPVLTGELTLAAWGAKCLNRRELSGVRDIENDRNRFKCHIGDHELANLPLRSVTPSDVREWLRDLERKRASDKRRVRRLSARTVRRCFSLLSVMFKMAVEEGLREDNPARDVTLAKRGRVDEEVNYLSPAEQEAILDCADIAEADKLRIMFAVYTGLRQGEQRCLETRDVHLDGSNPYVLVRWGSPGRSPKNGKIRRVPLIPAAVELLRRWFEILPTYAKKNPHRLVWPTPRGCRRQQSKDYGFKEQLATVGITRPMRWHDLRHTFASSLLTGAWGRPWRMEEVSKVLGHSSIQTTQVYAHLATSVVQEAANATPGLARTALQSAPSADVVPLREPTVHKAHSTPGNLMTMHGTTEPKVVRSSRSGQGPACWSFPRRTTALAKRGSAAGAVHRTGRAKS